MKGFFREAQKSLFRWPCLILIFCALILNAFLFYTRTSGDGVESSVYKKANSYLQTLPEEGAAEFLARYREALEKGEWEGKLLFSDDIFSEQSLIREFEDRFAQIHGYSEYLQSIQDKAVKQEISIFQNVSDYTRRDLGAAAKAFRPLLGKSLVFVNSDTFLAATDFVATDLFLLGVLFYLVVSMVIYEKEQGLFRLLCSMADGRETLARSKMGVGIFASILLTLLFWGENLWLAMWKYGLLDFSAPVQSVLGYDGCALNLNIGQYLLLFWVSKAAVYMVISLLMLFIGMKAENTMKVYLGVLLAAGILGAFYLVGEYSGLHILHYLNLIFFIQVNTVYRFYFNLNFFQYPFPVTALFWVSLFLAGSLFWGLNRKVFSRGSFVSGARKGVTFWQSRRKSPSVSVFAHERYKLFISNHGLLILCLFLAIQCWLYGQKRTVVGMEEYYYKQYMEDMAGELTPEKEEFLRREKEAFDGYRTMMEEKQAEYNEKKISDAEMGAVVQLVSQKLEPEQAFLRLTERVEFAKQNHTPLIYESGFRELCGKGFSRYRDDVQQAILFVIAMILLLAPFCAREYSQGMMRLIRAQYHGRRKTFLAKLGAGMLACVLCFLIAYVPQILYIGKVYGYGDIRQSIDAVPELAGGFLHCSLWKYLLLLYALRFLTACMTTVLVMAAAVYRKNTVQSMSLLFAALVFPLGLHMIGVKLADYCSLNAIYSMNQILNPGKVWAFALGVSVLCLIFAGGFIYLYRTMGREKFSSRRNRT